MNELEKKILAILQAALQNKVSDIHFAVGQPAAFRTRDGLTPLPGAALSEEEILGLCHLLVTKPEMKAKLAAITDLDGSFEFQNLGRFRYNIFRHKNHLGAVLRVVPARVPTIDELGLPAVLKKIAEVSRGLVLVTGATGCGKSSTLAAMIDHINNTRADHVLTIEDPVEFVHLQKHSRVTQREVGRDTENYSAALRSALRQDPDVILIGEIRDLETLQIAVKAAETGHVVLSTVHTTDVIKTIGYLVAMVPTDEQQAMRLRLADNLYSVISQRLVNCKDGKSRVAAQEIMVADMAIRECIANEKRTGEMNGFIEKGFEVLGSQTFNQHLSALVRKGMITVEVASEAATNAADLQRNLVFGESAGMIENNSSSLNIQMDESKSLSASTAAPDTSSLANGQNALLQSLIEKSSSQPALTAPSRTTQTSLRAPGGVPQAKSPGAPTVASAAPGMPKIPKPPKAA